MTIRELAEDPTEQLTRTVDSEPTTAELPPVVDGDRANTPSRRLARRRLLRVLGHASWVLAFAGWATWQIGRFGFSATDQGFTLALSWRIVHGEIPHADIISARPLGSALLHTFDFTLPGSLFLNSAMVTMVEITVTAMIAVALCSGRPITTWGPALTTLVAASALVNLHTVPLTAWHTIDGALVAVLGWWVLDDGLRTGRIGRRRVGLLLVGFAAITKQSFAPAAVVAVAMVLAHPHRPRGGRRGARQLTILFTDACFLAAAPLAYFGVIAADGGLGDAITQFGGAQPVWGQRLLTVLATDPAQLAPHVHRTIAAAIGLAALLVLVRSLRATRFGDAARALDLAVSGLLCAAVVYVVLRSGLGSAGDWGIELLWVFLAVVLADAAIRRRFPYRGLLLVALAWMISLSWGADSPTLLGGTLALVTALTITQGMTPLPFDWRPGTSTAERLVPVLTSSMAGLLVAGLVVVAAHDTNPYRDQPSELLSADLGSVTPTMAGIRTTAQNRTYIEQIKDCVQQYPATWTAVLPDNPFVYPALRLRNPFPSDWPIPLELVGDARQRMARTADQLNRDGDYLVLFETVDPVAVGRGAPVPATVAADTQPISRSDADQQIRARLTGRQVSCGSFVGAWAPPPRGR